jgi:hypothetical protein
MIILLFLLKLFNDEVSTTQFILLLPKRTKRYYNVRYPLAILILEVCYTDKLLVVIVTYGEILGQYFGHNTRFSTSLLKRYS